MRMLGSSISGSRMYWGSVTVALALVISSGQSQADARVPVVGILFAGVAERSPQLNGLYERLAEVGYVSGKSIHFVLKSADGYYSRLPALARELEEMKPDVIVCSSSPAVQAAMQITQTIPIVMVVVGDPIGQKFAKSFAHPGGNVTGPTLLNNQSAWKQVEALRELLPHASRVAALWNPLNPHGGRMLQELHAAAASVGIELTPVSAQLPSEINAALTAIARLRPAALIVVPDPVTKSFRREIIDFANNSGLPSFFTDEEDVAEGGLVAYGTNVRNEYRRAANYVQRILKGARPADLPIEQPADYDLSINTGTAKRLGLAISLSLRLRADRIFE